MAGIDDIKLWRSEPPIGDWKKLNPNHPTLGWKYPYQGRWYTSNLDFVRDWGGSGNIIKELDIKSPIPLAKEFHGPPTWLGKLPTYPPKTILELLDDIKKLKKWVPTEGMGSRLDTLYKNSMFRDLYGKVIDDFDGPLISRFEEYMRTPALKNMITLVPPSDLADKGSVNVWQSIKKNLWKPRKYGGIFHGGQDSWLKGILELPQKIKYLNELRKAKVPMHSGINWQPAARFGLNTLRTIGGVGNVALAGQALSDVYTETNFIGDMATNINKWAGVPFKDDGTVQTSIKDYKASLPKPKYAMPPKGAAGFNSGGIASLVI